MNLSKQQIEQFDRDGYLFLPTLFTPQEVSTLLNEVPALYAQRRAENIREKGSDAVRTNFAAHLYNRQFAKLARHPRMVEPIQKLLGEPVYMHQFKINGKMAFDGDVWQWHQDYGTWKNDDLMPEPRAMNVAIFLSDVNEFNGPLMFIPGSHKSGVARNNRVLGNYIGTDVTGTAALGNGADGVLLSGAVNNTIGGTVAGAGNVISGNGRIGVYLSLCAVSNHIRRFKRPGYIAHREFTPIECLPDDCLVKDYDVPLPWKDGTPEEALKPLSAA